MPDFFDDAVAMRRAIDERFAYTRGIDPARFAWEYWHAPELFTYLRALPQAVFPAELLESLMARLRNWGREQLGCRSVYLPMLNCHLHDCWHNLHSDGERGPWAYVLSLTDWSRREFSGGETLILDPARAMSLLAVPDHHDPLFVAVTPHFNQLALFDARLPHSVRRVEGVRDVVKGRLALAGWYSEPGLIASTDERAAELTELYADVHAALVAEEVTGRLVIRIGYSSEGAAASADVTVNSLTGASDGVRPAVGRARQRLLTSAGPVGGWATFPFHLETGPLRR